MTDERFDRDMRAAVDSLTDVHASPELRARVDRVLAAEVGPAQRREARAWLRAGLAMAAVLALAVVVGWASLRPAVVVPAASASPSPATSPAASSVASAPTTPPATIAPDASSAPTLPPYLGMPVVTVPGFVPATTRVTDPTMPQAGGTPQGPYVYEQAGTTLTVVDADGGSVRVITPPLLAGEGIASVVWSRDWLALVVANPVYPCGIPERRDRTDWRILVASLGADGLPRSDGFRVVAHGTSTTPFILPGSLGLTCAYPPAPAIALDGDLLATALPADSHHGSPIAVRSLSQVLATTDQSATLTASQQVVFLAVSEAAVAWVQSANGLTNGQKSDWSVHEAVFGGDGPVAVPIGETASTANLGPDIVLDGAAVVVNRDQYEAVRGSVVRVDGGTLTTVAPESKDRQCFAIGGTSARVVLWCNGSNVIGNTGQLMRSWLAIWSPDGGLRAIGADGVPYWIDQAWIVGDQLVWSETSGTSPSAPWLFGAVALSTLAAAP